MIGEVERARMLSVPPCGSRVLQRRERIGVRSLCGIGARDLRELMREIIRQAARVRWNTSTRAG